MSHEKHFEVLQFGQPGLISRNFWGHYSWIRGICSNIDVYIEDKNEDLKKYYGIYHKNPEKFKFVIGDKLLLQQLVEFVKNKPIHYWGDTGSSSQHNTITSIQHALNHPFEIDTEAQKKKLQRQIATMVKKNSAKFSLEFDESERLSVEENSNRRCSETKQGKYQCNVRGKNYMSNMFQGDNFYENRRKGTL